jgi:hypothetical protein
VSKFGVGHQKQASSSSGGLGENSLATKSKVAFTSCDENDENLENVCNRSVTFADHHQSSRVAQQIKMHQSSGKERKLLGEISLEDLENDNGINDDEGCFEDDFDHDMCDKMEGEGLVDVENRQEDDNFLCGQSEGDDKEKVLDPFADVNDNCTPGSIITATPSASASVATVQAEEGGVSYHSPAVQGFGNADVHAKTPTLADWKLSEVS